MRVNNMNILSAAISTHNYRDYLFHHSFYWPAVQFEPEL